MNNLALPIQSLTNEEEMAVQQFIFELKQQFKDAIYAITLYGSKARGDALVDSDIDLLIVMDSDAWETRNRAAIPGALCKSTRGRDRFCGKIFTKTSRFYLWERELLEIG